MAKSHARDFRSSHRFSATQHDTCFFIFIFLPCSPLNGCSPRLLSSDMPQDEILPLPANFGLPLQHGGIFPNKLAFGGAVDDWSILESFHYSTGAENSS